jgi:NAD(P)-dependent dehydrogenase (short-subunit alcohol dehydrogenase family)
VDGAQPTRDFSGKAVIVTGATKGIGRATALAFARASAAVLITGRTEAELDSLAAEIAQAGGRGVALAADLALADSPGRIADEAVRAFGGIDVLFNNAAIIHDSFDLAEFDPALWRRVIEVNLVAPAMLIRAVLPHMIAAGGGKIVNVSSIGGTRGGAGRSAYRAAKAGLINLTESVAAEVKSHGIDVTGINPGATDTEGFRAAFDHQGRAQDASVMAPEEIAEIALFLASPAASAITGTAINAFGATNPIFNSGAAKGRV